MECAHITVRGFNAHYNKWVTFTNLKLEVEGLYQMIQNENILGSLVLFFALPVFANFSGFSRLFFFLFVFLTIMHVLKVRNVLVRAGSVRKMSTNALLVSGSIEWISHVFMWCIHFHSSLCPCQRLHSV